VASIQKRVRNGKISYRVRYRDPTGRQRSKVFARKVDADNWLHANETAKQERRWVDPAAGRERFGEWAERWYATTAALRPTTRRDYRVLLDRQVLPAFAAARLADLDALAVREWLAGLVDAGLSAKRTRKAHQVLAQVLDTAVDGDKLARNVAAGVKLPKVQRREVGFLDAVQVEAPAEAIDPRYSTLVRFAAYSGLRPCELVARGGPGGRRAAGVGRGQDPMRPAQCGYPGRSPRSWAPTSQAGPATRRISCSPRRWAARCASQSSSPATASRPSGRPGCRRRCGSTTFATLARACLSARALASRRSRPSSATPPPASPSTPTAICSPTNSTSSPPGWKASGPRRSLSCGPTVAPTSSRSAKVQVSERSWGCRRRGSNPPTVGV
jgi:hypothetical protein